MPEVLPDHAFPLQDLELERTDLFARAGTGEKRARILMGMRDPGEAAVLLPILEQLRDRSVDIFMWADSRAKGSFQPASLGFQPLTGIDPLLGISAIKADLVVTGMSMSPGSELALSENAHYDGVPVVWISDYVMGSLLKRNRDIIGTNILPDYLLVANDWVEQQELKNLPTGFSENRVVATGHPGFDRIAGEDKEGVRTKVRQELGVGDNEKLITSIGAIGEVSPQSLRVLVAGLAGSGFENYKLVIRTHPRDPLPREEYLKLAQPIGEKVVDSEQKSTDEVILASDLVVNTLSTAGMEAIYRGVPVVHVWIRKYLSQSELGGDLPLPPIVEDGTSPAIFEESQAAEVLKKTLSDMNYQANLSSRMARWKVDGRASERVTSFILDLLKL